MHFRNMSPIEVPQCFIIKLTNIILCLRFSRICKCRTASNQWRSGVKNAIPALHRLLKALSMTLVMQIWYMQCYSLERLFFFFFLPKYCLQKKLRSSESKCAHICTCIMCIHTHRYTHTQAQAHSHIHQRKSFQKDTYTSAWYTLIVSVLIE